ncbi:Pyrophosphatase PpaX [Elizabethkingia miricola]|nr:Pyrophosphatase PpaX [Elizabethkingia miricola]
MTANTVLFPEISSVLNTLKGRSAKIGIVSTKYRIMEFIDKNFPKDFFDIIIDTEDVTAHKPD